MSTVSRVTPSQPWTRVTFLQCLLVTPSADTVPPVTHLRVQPDPTSHTEQLGSHIHSRGQPHLPDPIPGVARP